jgi:formylglycine-generating enzyme required for sulfatase activity
MRRSLLVSLLVVGVAAVAACGGPEGGGSQDPDAATPPLPLGVPSEAGIDAEDGLRSLDVELLAIPPGTFAMGSTAAGEGPVHEVTVSAFAMAKLEVTQGLFSTVMGRDPSAFPGDPNLPVANVSFYDAIAFANALSKAAGLEPAYSFNPTSPYPDTPEIAWNRSASGYRLPTEAEWEYAARAGTTTDTYAGDLTVRQFACQQDTRLDPIAVYCRSGAEGGLPVGSRLPNKFGLHDMLGNVWEWVWDWEPSFVPSDYDPGAAKDPTGKVGNGSGSGARILRGGSWFWPPASNRAASRIAHVVNAEYAHPDFGFRLAGPTSAAGKKTIRIAPASPHSHESAPATPGKVEMIAIPGGTFRMGTTPATQRTVTVSAFQMSKYEVTVGQYVAVLGKAPGHQISHNEDPNLPVGGMTWYDIAVFANELSKREGVAPAYTIRTDLKDRPGNPLPSPEYVVWNAGAAGYRIPTEAEWEYAARAGSTTTLPGSNRASDASACVDDPALSAMAWYCFNSGTLPHPVGQKAPNAFGLYDMIGNLSEWTWDWSAPPSGDNLVDPKGPEIPGPSGRFKVVRGGSYLGQTNLHGTATRGAHIVNQYYGHHDYGIRLARSL